MNKKILLKNTLRIAAEAQLSATSPRQIHPAEKLLYELQVHQIELEMQNEELRRAQITLDCERARYFDLYDLAPMGYITVSEMGLVLQANLMACTLLGVPRGVLVRQPVSRFMLTEDADIFYLMCRRVLSSGKPQSRELRMMQNDGTRFWVSLAASVARDADGEPELRMIMNDITDRKQIETSLRESEAFSLAILDSVTAEIAVLDRQGVILAVNQTWKFFSLLNSRTPGKPAPQTEVGANYLAVCRSNSCFTVDDASDASKGIQSVLDGRLPVFNMEYPCHSPQDQRWFSMSVTPLGPDRRGVVVTHTNITERKQAETELRIAAVAFECQEGIVVMDADQKILQVNQAFIKMTGYTQQDVQGKATALLRSDQQPVGFYEEVWRETIQTGAWFGEVWLRRKGGFDFIAQIAITAVKDECDQVTHYVLNLIDVTHKHQQEQKRLLHEAAQRDALVREVHHRIKNNLQGITGLLRQFVLKHPGTAEPINQAISQVQGISIIYGLQGSSNAASVLLCELIQAIALQIQTLWQTLVTVEMAPTWLTCVITENETVPIALVLNELIVNAVKHGGQASGKVHITLRKSALPFGVEVVISNVGQLAGDATPLGTPHSGLQLISALMPRTGARLVMAQEGERVITLLELAPPVIFC